MYSFSFCYIFCSKEVGDRWRKILGEKLIYLQLVALWIVPIVCWLPMWLQKDVVFDTSSGKEDGYVCYPYRRNSTSVGSYDEIRVSLTPLQYLMLLVTDLLVLSTLILSGVVVLCRYKQRNDEILEREENNAIEIFRHTVMTKAKKKSLNNAMGLMVAAFVVLRLPFFIMASLDYTKEYGTFNWWFRISVLFYVARFSVMPFLFGSFNSNAKRAYSDLLESLTPKCFKNGKAKRAYYDFVRSITPSSFKNRS